MKALILNSGVGSRMGAITAAHPKCMTPITETDTILSRQLRLIKQSGIREVVITTGPSAGMLMSYCESLGFDLNYEFIHNPLFLQTNYIYSIYLARHEAEDDLLLMHGDLVFEAGLPGEMLSRNGSSMVISTALPLPEKDFKAVVADGFIKKVGIEYFEQAYAAQPLYKLTRRDWGIWLAKICEYCRRGERGCYAENALNEVSGQCGIYSFDVGMRLCREIDTTDDLKEVRELLKETEEG